MIGVGPRTKPFSLPPADSATGRPGQAVRADRTGSAEWSSC